MQKKRDPSKMPVSVIIIVFSKGMFNIDADVEPGPVWFYFIFYFKN